MTIERVAHPELQQAGVILRWFSRPETVTRSPTLVFPAGAAPAHARLSGANVLIGRDALFPGTAWAEPPSTEPEIVVPWEERGKEAMAEAPEYLARYWRSAQQAIAEYGSTYASASAEPQFDKLYNPVFKSLGQTRPEIANPAARPDAEGRRWLWLRGGLAALLLLLTVGLLLASFAMATDASPLLRGLAVAAMWAGQAAVVIGAHMEGRRSGTYLLGKRLSEPAVIFAVGMVIVVTIATIEFSVR